jgi:hypothetical protein
VRPMAWRCSGFCLPGWAEPASSPSDGASRRDHPRFEAQRRWPVVAGSVFAR